MGMILGTAAYMSPEQARGRAVDRRSDIWAFGCVLYEMLTARLPFDGDTIVDVLGAVARLEPDLDALPPEVPPRVRRVLQLCLRKDVRQRAQAMGDVRLALEGAFETVAPSTTVPATASARGARLAWAAFCVAVLAATALAVPAVRHWRETAPAPLAGRFNVSLPATDTFALSPSGRLLAFTSVEGGPRRIWIRPLDSLDARVVRGTEDADLPFWSPDEDHLGFFAQGKLKTIAVSGGPAQILCDAPTPRGGTWNRDGVILFAPNITGALFRVDGGGGVPVPVTKPADARHSHRLPEFIAGGNRFTFLLEMGSADTGIYAGSLDGAPPTRVLSDASRAVYVSPRPGARTGALLFKRESTLMALPFDGETARAMGEAVPVAQDVAMGDLVGNFGAFAASDTGVLVYRTTGTSQRQTLTWIDRKTTNPSVTEFQSQPIESLALSPDESQVAVTVRAAVTGSDLWLHDLRRGVPARFTFGPGRRRNPSWSPDGRSIVFVVTSGATSADILRKPSSGAGAEELLLPVGSNATTLDISRDGRLLLYSVTGTNTKDDLWIVPLEGERTPVKYLDGPAEERHGQFSPDGRRIAYSSDESGQFQVYVQTVPVTGDKRQISTQGGSRPRWRKDGKELYYVSADDKLMAVPVTLGPGTLELGAAERLFDLRQASGSGLNRAFLYAPAANGQKFLASVRVDGAASPVTIWMNWMAGIGK